MNFGYANDLVIFGVDSRRDDNLRVLPVKHLSVLLVKRTKEPDEGKWGLPGGFINIDETSKDASVRVLKKETGLDNVYMQQIGVNDLVSRDSRGRIISTTYMALVDRTLIKDELNKDASWFDLEINDEKIVLSNQEDRIEFKVKRKTIDEKSEEYEYELVDQKLTFDHDIILYKALMELRNKVKNTDIVFNLMPELFTVGELKQVYELLLGKKLINSAFRRWINDRIEFSGQYVSTGGHRPSELCRYKVR
ncbi:MAG: NUDIX hydrolase [Bacilli bacterium]|nr:NUDIX hydrolase [Bacilli bacterium]